MSTFLQTNEWIEFQRSIGRKVWRFDDGKIVANIIQHDLPFGKNYLYIPHGPELKLDEMSEGIKNELGHFVDYLKNLAREQESIFIKIEPLQDSTIEMLHSFGFKKSAKEIQPHRSVIVDLEKSEEELLGAMHHKTRYNIRVGERKGLQLREKDDLESFWTLLKHTSEDDNFSTHEKSYYQKLLNTPALNARTVFVEHDVRPLDNVKDRLIAGAIVLTYGDTLYYLHGAMDRDYKSMMAPYVLHWQIIKWAQKQGLKFYDFWGIDAQKWSGVTRFKLGWGGRQVEYPGAFDMPIRPFWFMAYKILRKIF